MENEVFKEEIICGQCKKIIYRNIEVKEINMRSEDTPLKFIIIKKFTCDICGESENHQIKIKKLVLNN